MKNSLALVLSFVAGSAISGVCFAQGAAEAAKPAAGQPAKKAVKTADDLPRHTYKIEGKASEFLMTDAPFKALLASVKKDAAADLAEYDITDRTTLQGYYSTLQSIAMFEGDWATVQKYVDLNKGLEEKASKKAMMGHSVAAYIAAKGAGAAGSEAFNAAFKAELAKRVGALDYNLVKEELKQGRARAQMITKDLIMGQIESGLDPVIEANNGEISGDIGRQLVSMRANMDVMLPMQPLVAEVFGGIITANTTTSASIWPERQVVLKDGDKASPVVVCIWDSGVDTSLFPNQLWTNTKETVNGKDDDANGFVDDVNGIAWDLDSRPVIELLHPLNEMKSDPMAVMGYTKGMSDLQFGIESKDADKLKDHMKSLKGEQVKVFMEDLGLFGNYSHGTHVAGIAAEGNAFARLLPIRITFDFREIPTTTPNKELAERTAAAAQKSIDYMRAAGVRVVNMSWGGTRKDVENALEAKGWGKTAEERAAFSRELFMIEKNALEAAMKSAPEILFVVAAGNSDNDNTFAEMIPSGLSLPNMLTVGAVDAQGKPTGFTTMGKNVEVYANGYAVESYVPGGTRLQYNGTSMASPGVANLAAKVLAVRPELNPEQVIDLIKQGCDPMPGGGQASEGRYIINPKKTFDLIK